MPEHKLSACDQVYPNTHPIGRDFSFYVECVSIILIIVDIIIQSLLNAPYQFLSLNVTYWLRVFCALKQTNLQLLAKN